MIRRSFLAGGAFASLMIAIGVGAVASASGSYVLKVNKFTAPSPTPGRNAFNALKATATFRINNQNFDRYLVAYGNGNGSGARQCVDLIKRYAAGIEFPNFKGRLGSSDNSSNLPSLGNGYQAASRFAVESGGSFVYVTNGDIYLPKPRSVISIERWRASNGTWIEGHVGIVIDYVKPSSSANYFSIKIFEQNMSTDKWTEVIFTRSNGKWYGYMMNKGVQRHVVGWAKSKL